METTRPPLDSSVGDLRARLSSAERAERKPYPLRWLTCGLLAVLVIAIALPFAAYAYTVASRVILPGVHVRALDVAGMSVSEAAEAIHKTWNLTYQITAVDTTDPSRAWTARPIEFGLSVDAGATAERAYQVGHVSDVMEAARQIGSSYEKGQEVAPVVRFDPIVARVTLESWAPMVSVPAREAELAIQAGQVVAVPGSEGKALDIEAVLNLVSSDPAAALDYGIIPLAMTSVSPQIMDVSETAGELERMLATDTTLGAYDPVTGERFAWAPAREEKARWILLERGQDAYRFSIDDTKISEYLTALQADLGAERYFNVGEATGAIRRMLQGGGAGEGPLIVRYQPRAYKVRSTDSIVSIGFRHGIPYWRLQDFNPQLAVRGLVPGETITIPPRDYLLSLPSVVDKRIVISIKEQRLRVYEGGTMVREFVVSTGIDRSPTMPGIFQVQSHELSAYASRWDLTMPNFLAIYEAVPDFWNGIHGLPTLSNGVRLWGSVLGRPASYGCIILDLDAAEELYQWAEDGTVVEITP